MLLEAIVLVVLDEVNLLRAKAGLSGRTKQKMRDAIEAKHATLEIPDFMIRQDTPE